MNAVGAGALLAVPAPARRAGGGETGQGGADFMGSLQGAVDAGPGEGNAVAGAMDPVTPAGSETSESPADAGIGAVPLVSWALPPLGMAAPFGTAGTAVPGNMEATAGTRSAHGAPLTGVAGAATSGATALGADLNGAGTNASGNTSTPAAENAVAPTATAAGPTPAGAAKGDPVTGTVVPSADASAEPRLPRTAADALPNGAGPNGSAPSGAAPNGAAANGARAAAGPSSAPAATSGPVAGRASTTPAQATDQVRTSGVPAAAIPVADSEPLARDGAVLPKTSEGPPAQIGAAPNPATVIAGPASVPTQVQQVPPAQATPVANQPGHPPLAEQLSRPIFALATGQSGSQVMTVQVVPDSLGPVTVRAHMAADGMRIELLATTDAGRDGLRLIMTDLKRDLAGQGISSSLSLNPDLGGGAGGSGQAFRGNTNNPTGSWQQGPGREVSGTEPQTQAPTARTPSTISLDITV